MGRRTVKCGGYAASVEWSDEEMRFTGEVVGIRHIIGFGGATMQEAYANFKEMIDDYPAMCAAHNIEPCLPPVEAVANVG